MRDDPALQAVSVVLAVALNGLVFVGMAFAGLMGKIEENPPPPAMDVDLLELPKLGEPPPPEALPRIVQAPEPAPPETDTASLSREIEEAEERKREEEKKERELAEQRRRDEEAQKEEEKARKKAMADALRKVRDPRADDEDAPAGFREGMREGTSTDPNSLYNRQVYLSRLITEVTRQAKVPANISAEERRRLKADVQFNVGEDGKVKGEPRLKASSGNRFFDDAALATVRKFGPGSALKLPLPTDEDFKRLVLQKGITVSLDGKKMN